MGTYLNPGSKRFEMSVASEVFVDKTAMISYLNSCVDTNKRFVCVSRPRRFGKTMAADMVCAYYGRGADGARALFEGAKLAATEPVTMRTGEVRPWDAFLGAFDVVRVTVTDFLKRKNAIEDAIDLMQRRVARELVRAYPGVDCLDARARLVSFEGEIPFENYLRIDNTHIPPEEAARMIREHFSL